MRIPFIHGPGTIGREDRLVRGCIALSFLLLAGFAVVMSGQSSVITIIFVVLGLYFTLTSALGRDPFYAHFAIDTRRDAPRGGPGARPLERSVGPWRVFHLRGGLRGCGCALVPRVPHRAGESRLGAPLSRTRRQNSQAVAGPLVAIAVGSGPPPRRFPSLAREAMR